MAKLKVGLTAVLATTLIIPQLVSATTTDVTSKVETIGQPLVKAAYARNVWDMQVFDNKIYIGQGNSSNSGPSPNAGPIPITYLDPVTSSFVVEKINFRNPTTGAVTSKSFVDEEQIDMFKVLNGQLYIPGHDARGESWTLGNFYRLEEGGWQKYRNIPNGVHVYDMEYHNGNLYAALGTEKTADVVVSKDNGVTWSKAGTVTGIGGGARAYNLVKFGDTLISSTLINPPIKGWFTQWNVLAINHLHQTSTPVMTAAGIMPGVTKGPNPPYSKLSRTTYYQGQALYIAGYPYNDHQITPVGMFTSSGLNQGVKVDFPVAAAIPVDILTRPDGVLALTYVKHSNTSYTIRVYKSSNLKTWTELFQFKQDTYAKSFEELNGDFYFGLGTDMEYISESSGKILRVPQAAYQQ